MQRLLDAIETGQVDRLVVDRLDRLTRRLIDLLMLLERLGYYQVELVVVSVANFSNSATSGLMTQIVAAASEFQQNLTRERMADLRAALKRQGKRVEGWGPFGYCADRVTKKLMPHHEYSTIVRDFFELAAIGARPSDLTNLAREAVRRFERERLVRTEVFRCTPESLDRHGHRLDRVRATPNDESCAKTWRSALMAF